MQTDEPTHPHPIRFWWLKRLSALALALFVLLLLVRLAWGWHMNRRLSAAHALLRARGGAVSADDLNQQNAVPPEENAATHLNKATAALRPVYGPSSSMLIYAEYPPYPPAWHRLADASVKANAPAFAEARAARPYPRADWGVRYISPLLAPAMTGLNTRRELANQLGDAALHAHVHDNDAAAIEYARDVLHLAHAADQDHTLVGHLVGLGIEALGLQRIIVMAPGIHVTAGNDVPPGATAPPGPGTRGQVAALIDHLLNAPLPGEGTASALLGTETVMLRDMLRWYTRANWIIVPAIDAIEVESIDMAIEGATAATRPSAPRPASAAKTASQARPELLGSWMGPVRSTYPRIIEQDRRLLAERRMAAVSLAAQLYRLDHAGRWPRRLDELVPAYLRAVPIDPFRADGGPLSYLIAKNVADGAERPLVYSVSSDGVDNTSASAAIVPAEPLYSWVSRSSTGGKESPDQWRDLSRFIPPKPPLTRGSGEDANGDGAPDDSGTTQPTTQSAADDNALQR